MADRELNSDEWEEVAPPTARGTNADEWEEIDPTAATTQPVQAPQGGIMDKVGRGLDYAGGMARTSIAHSPVGTGIDLLQSYLRSKDKKDMASKMFNQPGDLDRALAGKAPRTDEYLERAGVPKGGSLSELMPWAFTQTPEEADKFWRLKAAKGGLLDVSPRGTAGTIGDIATDPLTYIPLTKLAQGAGFLKKLMRGASQPVAKGAETAGEAYYKSAFKRPDAAVGDFVGNAAKKPSEVAMEHGVWGSDKAIEQRVKAITSDLSAEKAALLPQFKNQALNPAQAWSPDLAGKIAKLSADPETREVAEQVLKDVAEYGLKGPVSPTQIWEYQKSLNNAASSGGVMGNAFKNNRSLNYYKEIKKQMAKDLGNMLQGEATATAPELGKAFKSLNADLSPLVRSQRALRTGTKLEANRKGPLSQLGAAIFGAGAAGAAHTGGLSMLPYATYAGAKIAGLPGSRTGGGLLLNRGGKMLSEANVLDPLLRRKMIDQTEPGTWMNALKKQNGGNQ